MSHQLTSQRYVVISADCHAGGDIPDYKPYLEKRWHSDFELWASAFSDPWADLEMTDIKVGAASADSTYNWDSPKRLSTLESEGIVAEVLFPNTAPPFFPGGILTVGAPQTRIEYERRFAGLRAHNRWLVDFCNDAPGRRAGIAQVFLNDVDETLKEIRWSKEAGLVGGILLPADAPAGLAPVYYPRYDPIWELCADLDIPVHKHGFFPGDAITPSTGIAASAVGLLESSFFNHRALGQMIFAGVFDRFPRLTFIMTESGTGWVPHYLTELDATYDGALVRGSLADYFAGAASQALKRRPSEYFRTNCYIGASFLGPAECALRYDIGVDRIMWGSDLPHREGTYPFSREAMRAAFAPVPPDETRLMLGETAAQVFSFDLHQLQRIADMVGPTVAEVQTPLVDGPKFPEETVTPALAPLFLPGLNE